MPTGCAARSRSCASSTHSSPARRSRLGTIRTSTPGSLLASSSEPFVELAHPGEDLVGDLLLSLAARFALHGEAQRLAVGDRDAREMQLLPAPGPVRAMDRG